MNKKISPKINFSGSTPIANSTEDTQKSATSDMANSAEQIPSVGGVTTSTESALAKNDDGSATTVSASQVPDALGRRKMMISYIFKTIPNYIENIHFSLQI